MAFTLLHTTKGALDPGDTATFNALANRLAAGGKKVLLFLHGGLVSQQAGEEQARNPGGQIPSQ